MKQLNRAVLIMFLMYAPKGCSLQAHKCCLPKGSPCLVAGSQLTAGNAKTQCWKRQNAVLQGYMLRATKGLQRTVLETSVLQRIRA
eukprot:630930-Pelagomonas_calceolata.AAC.6